MSCKPSAIAVELRADRRGRFGIPPATESAVCEQSPSSEEGLQRSRFGPLPKAQGVVCNSSADETGPRGFGRPKVRKERTDSRPSVRREHSAQAVRKSVDSSRQELGIASRIGCNGLPPREPCPSHLPAETSLSLVRRPADPRRVHPPDLKDAVEEPPVNPAQAVMGPSGLVRQPLDAFLPMVSAPTTQRSAGDSEDPADLHGPSPSSNMLAGGL
jgi:hypothetical protein